MKIVSFKETILKKHWWHRKLSVHVLDTIRRYFNYLDEISYKRMAILPYMDEQHL